MSGLWNGLLEFMGGVLAFFFGIVPNIGIAIILLTLLVNVVVFPLTLRQTRSTRAMQEIQPEVEKLRKEHADNPQELNQAIMGLYKERGVSPAGCFLPMLVQMPIWFALFRVLREPELFMPESSSLFTALTAADPLRFLGMDVKVAPSQAFSIGFGEALPYLLLLAVVVGTGFLQQKLTAPRQAGDAANQNPQAATAQKLTKILPIFFGVISFVWPAGLNLYFATSNLFRTGQQLLIFKIDGRPEPALKAQEPAEEPEAPAKPKRPQGSAKKRSRRRRS